MVSPTRSSAQRRFGGLQSVRNHSLGVEWLSLSEIFSGQSLTPECDLIDNLMNVKECGVPKWRRLVSGCRPIQSQPVHVSFLNRRWFNRRSKAMPERCELPSTREKHYSKEKRGAQECYRCLKTFFDTSPGCDSCELDITITNNCS